MKLLAIIIAFAISHFWPKAHTVRPFFWIKKLSTWVNDLFKTFVAEIQLIIVVAIPIVVFFMVVALLGFDSADGLAYFIINVVVMGYTIGPQNLEMAIENKQLRKQLNLSDDIAETELMKAITQASIFRWFGVFFWFVVLGVTGAFIYRFCERIATHPEIKELQLVAKKTVRVLNYPVIWTMGFSLAIATDFENIWKIIKPYFQSKKIKSMQDGFIYESVAAAVDKCELKGKKVATEQIIEHKTLLVLYRMLVVWLVFISILVIFTWLD